ncbi:MAG: pantoate--beta-alanine ligase [Nocardioidaceae bacterium]
MTPSIADTVNELNEALTPSRLAMSPVAYVPTMGALHEGHAELMRTARAIGDVVVVSVFVNPTQFGPDEDFSRYPRTLDADLAMCEKEGVDIVFVPSADEMYPFGIDGGPRVDPGPRGTVLEGASRPTHFHGVLTVVTKLLSIVRPSQAVFGEKDYQQLVLIRDLVRTLFLGVDIVPVPIVRESDGLALSSRNAYLTEAERRQALALSRALFAGRDAAGDGAAAVLAVAQEVLDAEPQVEVDYLALTDPELEAPPQRGEARLLVASRVGATRLIDNVGFTLDADGE